MTDSGPCIICGSPRHGTGAHELLNVGILEHPTLPDINEAESARVVRLRVLDASVTVLGHGTVTVYQREGDEPRGFIVIESPDLSAVDADLRGITGIEVIFR